jgi:hypothetical protein
VRGSPLKRGPEDMPLPSIESTSSNTTTPRTDERHSAHETFNHSQDVHPRRVVEPRLQTPAAREVIVINDDTPPIKRRRMVYEDDSASFRPVPSRDHGPYISAPHSASHLISAPSAPSEDFIVQRPAASSYSAQGLVRREPEFYTDPVTAERLPVYDAPAPVYLAQRSENTRRMEVERIPVRNVEDRTERAAYSQEYRDNMIVASARNPTSLRNREGFQEVDRDYVRQVQSYHNGARAVKPLSPEYPVSQQSRSYYGFPDSNGPDREFIHSFSQSRLDGPTSQARDGFTVISERSRQNVLEHGNESRYEDYSNRSDIPEMVPRARSPPRYIGSSM